MAYDIIDRFETQKEKRLLAWLRPDVLDTDRKRGKKHEAWIDSFDVK